MGILCKQTSLFLKILLLKKFQQLKRPFLVSKHSGVKAQNLQINPSISELAHPQLTEVPECTVSVFTNEGHAQSFRRGATTSSSNDGKFSK